jgi:hypothetical protein
MMKAVRILGCAAAITLAMACSAADFPTAGQGTTSGAGGGFSGVGGSAGFGGSMGPTKGGIGDVGTYAEAVVEPEEAPPPIAGGTLAIIAQGKRAALSDPDHDQIVVIDLETMTIAHTVPLAHGDDPGRLVEDAGGRLHVALRAGRGVAVVDPTGTLVGRLATCPQPRGLAYDYDSDTIHVACAGGELVSYTASDGTLIRNIKLDRDLRDVVVDGERLLVSRFRAAQLLVVEGDGTVSQRLAPPGASGGPSPLSLRPSVAWRTIPAPGGGAIMVHQMVDLAPLTTTPGGYGGTPCRKIISAGATLLRVGSVGWTAVSLPLVLPVDIALSADGSMLAIPSAGRSPSANFGAGVSYAAFPTPPGISQRNFGCGALENSALPGGNPTPLGRVTAVAFDNAGQLALQTREPAMFHLGSRAIALPGPSRKHTGHELFHLATAGGLACASCHPEGTDDALVWNFVGFGPRRTQSLAGGIAGTEPFHWSGDMHDFSELSSDVFSGRMSGPRVQAGHTASLLNWINTIPRRATIAASDPAAAERGQVLYNDATVGCASCHSGPRLTNNATVSVSTGEPLQVPSLLGIAWRAPYMHNGCAPTLLDRFGAYCGGGDSHGKTSHLSNQEKADLVTYLETL